MKNKFQVKFANPKDFPFPIHVIGAGSVGSYIVLMLAKLGFTEITAYDFDVVEPHNTENQVYGPKDVGRKKVEALKDIIILLAGREIKTECREIISSEFSGIVILAVDSMTARKQIWQNCLRRNIEVRLVIEIRMSKESGTIFAVRPNDQKEVACYEKSLYDDSEVMEEDACEMRGTAPIASSIANHAVFQLLNFINMQDFPNEVIMVMPQHFIETHSFKTKKRR